jgi:25S rRNA (uracil2634-N3)-methyltransferase
VNDEENNEDDEGGMGMNSMYHDKRILTVGDGDLSFSQALVAGGAGSSLFAPRSVTATSYESLGDLTKYYGSEQIEAAINGIENGGSAKVKGKVLYSIDARKLSTYAGIISSKSEGKEEEEKYDVIVWNFPCTAEASGQDGQNSEMEANKTLLRDFVQQAKVLLKLNGEIHITHKSKPPYNQWKMDELIVGDTTTAIHDKGETVFVHLASVVFDKYLYPPYTNRKARDKKSFPCHDALTYVFGLQKKENNAADTATDDAGDGSAARAVAAASYGARHAGYLVKVNAKMIVAVRQNIIRWSEDRKLTKMSKGKGRGGKFKAQRRGENSKK